MRGTLLESPRQGIGGYPALYGYGFASSIKNFTERQKNASPRQAPLSPPSPSAKRNGATTPSKRSPPAVANAPAPPASFNSPSPRLSRTSTEGKLTTLATPRPLSAGSTSTVGAMRVRHSRSSPSLRVADSPRVQSPNRKRISDPKTDPVPTERLSFPGDLKLGDRVFAGIKGTGTVVGAPSMSSLASSCVSVLWDNGRVSDERGSMLQVVSCATSKPPSSPESVNEKIMTPTPSLGSTTPRAAKVSTRAKLGSSRGSIGKSNPLDFVQQHIRDMDSKAVNGIFVPKGSRRNSQLEYADRHQTLIFFDWDDTLFPTNYLLHELRLVPDTPFSQQPRLQKFKDEITKKVSCCETQALKVLQEACQLGHVIVLTAAGQHGWVDRSCNWCYSEVGKFMKGVGIPIVYAQDPVRKLKAQAVARTPEEFWGLVKGHAISEEITKFYSQYEGQSWKNVLSIGDSTFERYGLLAASTAYMQGRRLSNLDQRQPFSPMQAKNWQKGSGDSHVKLRVKVCKLVSAPDVSELAIELELVTKWLRLIVAFDNGLDLNFECMEGHRDVAVVESVLRGRRPVDQLPGAAAIIGGYAKE